MIIGVKILPRNEVLDSQGRAVEGSLKHNGHTVEACRVGRYIQLNIKEEDRNIALSKAKEMTEFILYNPLIESFELEVIGE